MGETKFGSQKNPHIRTLSKLGSLQLETSSDQAFDEFVPKGLTITGDYLSLQATKFSLNIWVAINASESALRSWQAPSRGPWRPP